jgi:type IV pilus assembly protein PilQ
MNAYRRFALLTLFAVLGGGLAVGVAVLTRNAPRTKPRLEPLVVRTITYDDEPKEPADRLPSSPTRSRPVVVLPSPPVASEYVPSPQPPEPSTLRGGEAASRPDISSLAQDADPQLEKAMEYLQRKMAAQGVAPSGSADPSAASARPGAVPPPPAAGGVSGGKSAAPVKDDSISNRPIVESAPEGDGKLSIRLLNSDLREVLDMLSEQGGLNILAGKEVQGKVTANLNGVDLQAALDAILKSSGYTSRRQGKFVFVGSPEEFNTMEQAMDRVGARVYRPNYVTATELKTLITPLMTEKTGVVSVSSTPEPGIAASDSGAGATSSPAATSFWSATTRPCSSRSTRSSPRWTSAPCRSRSRR